MGVLSGSLAYLQADDVSVFPAGLAVAILASGVAAGPSVSSVDVLSGGIADPQATDVSAFPVVLAVASLASSVAAFLPVSSSTADGPYSGLAAYPAGDMVAVLARMLALLTGNVAVPVPSSGPPGR